jgi:hypothetical protein
MKHIFLTFSLLLIALVSNAQGLGSDNVKFTISNGIGIGSAIAVVASWSRNKSVLWAIIHGVLGWFYVVYYVLTRSKDQD